MARDYTKYAVNGLAEGLNKRQLVLRILQNWVERSNPDLSSLTESFPPTIQGSLGVFQVLSEIRDPSRFNMKEPLVLADGVKIAITNQWGQENIQNFILRATELSYEITIAQESDQRTSMMEKNNTPRFDVSELSVGEFKKVLQSINDRDEFEATLLRQVDLHIDFWSYLMVYDWEVNDGDTILSAEKMDAAEEILEIEWSEIGGQETSLVQFVLDKLEMSFEEAHTDSAKRILFSASFGSYLYFSLRKFACELDEDEIAAFLASNDHSMTNEGSNVFDTLGVGDDWVIDMADMWQKYCGIDPMDYEGDEMDVQLIDGSVKCTTINYLAMAEEVVACYG